jgi:hypothetical protein
MSRLDKIKAAITKPTIPDPPAILAKVDAHRVTVAALVERHAQAAYAWAIGETGEDVAALDAEMQKAGRELRLLEAAYAKAVSERAAFERRAQASLVAAQIRTVELALERRDKATAALVSALEAVRDAYHTALKHNDAALKATPSGMRFPVGSLCGLGEYKAAIEREMWRLMGDPSLEGSRTFPGARPGGGDLRLLNKPEAIEPLAEVITRTSQYVLDTLRGLKAPEPVVMAAPAVAGEPAEEIEDLSLAEEAKTLASAPTVDARAFVPQKVRLS